MSRVSSLTVQIKIKLGNTKCWYAFYKFLIVIDMGFPIEAGSPRSIEINRKEFFR